MKLVWIGIGGFAGAVLRYLAAGWVQRASGSVSFPYGTLAVNVIGCLLIGGLSYLADARGLLQAEVRMFLFVGVLGGFTTFSTFGYETMNLLRDGEMFVALMNVFANVVLCLLAVWAGRATALAVWR